jgi:hypothetical protein
MGRLPAISLGHGAAYGTPTPPAAQKSKIKSAHSILPRDSTPTMQPDQPAYEGDSAPQGLSQSSTLGSWQLVRPHPPSIRRASSYALEQIPATPNSPQQDYGTAAMNLDDLFLATASPTDQTFGVGDSFWNELFASISPSSEVHSSVAPVPSDAQPYLGPGK